jgi:hypothetical protein
MNTENNKIIADFMVREYEDNRIVFRTDEVTGQNPSGKVWKEVDYHYNWNSLMEVVEKCYEYGELGNDERQAIEESLIGIINIETTYEAVLEFIRWYNNQKN